MPLIECPECKKQISNLAGACPYCGYSLKGNTPKPHGTKNPGLAAVLSFFVPGLGQIYNGQIWQGIGLIVMYGVSLILIFVGIGFFTTPILWIVGMYDAYQQAVKINTGTNTPKKPQKSFKLTK